MVAPLAPERFEVQFTVLKETHDKLRRLQALLRREVPNGDAGLIFERFVDVLLAKVERDKLGKRRSRSGTTTHPRNTATPVERRLRLFLLALAASMCVGTIVELFLAKHYEDAIQLVPFVLCGVGMIALLAVLWRTTRRTLLALRGVMGLLLLGSLVGIYEHLATNLAFELEMRPGMVWRDVWFEALRGAAPSSATSGTTRSTSSRTTTARRSSRPSSRPGSRTSSSTARPASPSAWRRTCRRTTSARSSTRSSPSSTTRRRTSTGSAGT